MTRKHPAARRLVRRLRPAPERFAAAAALEDPNFLLQLRAAQSNGECPPRRPRSGRRPVGETGGALLPVAAVAVAPAWSNSPWHALLALLLTMRAIAGRQFRARGTSHPLLTPLSVLTGIALGLASVESGIGFTGSLLNASRAFDGAPLEQAKVGILATALLTPVLTVPALAPRRTRVDRLVLTTPCAA
jgi:hypothetical protein